MFDMSMGLPLRGVYLALLVSSLSLEVESYAYKANRLHFGNLPQVRSLKTLRATEAGNLDDMTVKDLKDLLRNRGLPVTGLKKQLIDRLTDSKATAEVDYLQTPKVNVFKRSLNLLTKKTKVSVGDNVSVLVDATEDEKKINKEKMPTVLKSASSKDANQSNSKRIVPGSARVSTPESAKFTQAPQKKFDSPRVQPKAFKRAAYDIDDDDFLEPTGAKQYTGSVIRSIPEDGQDEGEEPEPNTESARGAWPGPGVPWMSGPPMPSNSKSSKANQVNGRNAVMVPADNDIQIMIDERDEARSRRDFDEADALRDQLKIVFQVEVFDKLGEWVASDGRWGLLNRKKRSPQGGLDQIQQAEAVPCPYTFDQVQEMVVRRTAARRARRFSEADDIRDELAENGVELFDKVNEWASSDGTLRGVQSVDYEKYEVAKDRERFDRGYTGDDSDNYGSRGSGSGGLGRER